MNKSKAISIILSKHNNRILYERLTKWDDKKTIVDNATNIGVSIVIARMLLLKFRLGFKRDTFHKVHLRNYKREKAKYYAKKWNPDKTLEENAKLLDVPYSIACSIKNNYNLPFTKKYKSGLKVKFDTNSEQYIIKNAMKDLRDRNKMTLDQIGKIYGLTRERVRQMLL